MHVHELGKEYILSALVLFFTLAPDIVITYLLTILSSLLVFACCC